MRKLLNNDHRVIMRLEMYPQAKENLTKLCERLGMTQIAALGRIIEWLILDAEDIHEVVLDLYPMAIRAEVAALLLKKRYKKRLKTFDRSRPDV